MQELFLHKGVEGQVLLFIVIGKKYPKSKPFAE